MKKYLLLFVAFLLLVTVPALAGANRTVSFPEESYTVYIGKPLKLAAEVEHLDDSAPRQTQLAWGSSDETIAKVSQNGNVTGVSAGTAVIYAQAKDDESISGSVEIEVRKPIASLTLSSRNEKLFVGGDTSLSRVQLSCTVGPEDAYHQAVTWSSSNEKVATVDETGLVTAVSKGDAVITAAGTDPSVPKKASCQVRVEQLVTGVEFGKEAILVPVAKTVRITASPIPANASNKGLVWSSSDETVAKVSQDGTVRGIAKGEAVITAKAKDAGGYEATVKVTVVTPVGKITPSEKKVTLPVELSQAVTILVEPEDADVRDVVWSSSNEKVAVVDQDGVITGVGAGTATIFATAVDGSNVKTQVSVNVKKYDVVLKMSDKDVKVDFDTTGGTSGAYIQIGRYIMGDFDETTVTIKNGCVEGVDYQKLNPIKPGEDSITVTVKHNGRKVRSRKTYSVYVYDDSAEETDTSVPDGI